MAVPTAALCPLGEMATAVGDEETGRDTLKLEKEQEERRLCGECKQVSTSVFLHSDSFLPSDSGLSFILWHTVVQRTKLLPTAPATLEDQIETKEKQVQ